MSTHRASASNSGGFRAVGTRPSPVPYQQTTTVGEHAARIGWAPPGRTSPAHTPPRGQKLPRMGDGPALTALRVTTYVLVSLASLLFILLVVWGFLGLQEFVDTLPLR